MCRSGTHNLKHGTYMSGQNMLEFLLCLNRFCWLERTMLNPAPSPALRINSWRFHSTQRSLQELELCGLHLLLRQRCLSSVLRGRWPSWRSWILRSRRFSGPRERSRAWQSGCECWREREGRTTVAHTAVRGGLSYTAKHSQLESACWETFSP